MRLPPPTGRFGKRLVVVLPVVGLLAVPRPVVAAVVQDAHAPSLAVGANGLGVLAYRDRVTGRLMIGRCQDADCTAVTSTAVDTMGPYGDRLDMAIGPSGPVIVYEVRPDPDTRSVKLALCADAACTSASTVVLAPGLPGNGVAVAIGSDGRPLVAFDVEPLPTIHQTLVAHCDNAACSTVTTTLIGDGEGRYGLDIAIGSDGLGLVAHVVKWFTQVAHCANVACTVLSPQPLAHETSFSSLGVPLQGVLYPSLAIGTDLAALPVFSGASLFALQQVEYALVRRCQSSTCEPYVDQVLPGGFGPTSLAIDASNLPRIVVTQQDPEIGLDFIGCLDSGCTQIQSSCLTAMGGRPSLVLDGRNLPLVAYEIGDNVAVVRVPSSCGPVVTIASDSVAEAAGPTFLEFTVHVGHLTTPFTVDYATQDGSAQAGSDYVAASGTLTVAPPQDSGVILVEVLPDVVAEPGETMSVVLSNASGGTTIVDGQAVGTIFDDGDLPPVVNAVDCAVVEGATGSTTDCVFEARLSAPYPVEAAVQYATVPGTATADVDYLSQTGTLTFAPGSVAATASVPVIGDASVEPDETFTVALSNPVNALAGDMSGEATILDDDALSLSSRELTHGTSISADLGAAPGPAPDEDLYRIAQTPFASYEAILDALSGDASPGATLERLAADGSTVLQTGTATGTGTARSLRFQNRLSAPVLGQYVRVGSASCGTTCGPETTYRLRLYETTSTIARFNNSSSQVTVLLLQNPTSSPITLHVDFWDAGGARVTTQTGILAPRGLLVLNTASIPQLAGASGSMTVSHDGAYGALAGKAVALEPATGFSFDSPLTVKPR
jgi:hypothetical protein